MKLRIQSFIKSNIDFFTQDYNVLGLKKVRTFENGELKTVSYNDGEGSEVVREDIVYNRDDNNYIIDRVKTITWIRADGVDHPETKLTNKDYSSWEAAKAGERKRQNQITDMKITTIGLIAQTEQIAVPDAEILGISMILEMDREINMYILGAKQPLVDAINADIDCLWLDNDIGGITIRQYLVSELQK